MSLILKLDRDPAWLLPQAPSYFGTAVVLQGYDAVLPGQPVDVPADQLLAVSPLLRSILSAGHLPPAYHQPAISLCSASCQVLQMVKELFVSGMVSVDKNTKVTEIQSVFKMLGIEVELICDQLKVVKMEDETIEEYFEYSKTEEEFPKVKIHREVKSLDIVVKSEPDSIVELNDSFKRPSTSSFPLSFPSSPFPVSNVLQDPSPLSENSCPTCNKKFRNENELIQHALEQHNIVNLFRCHHCTFSANLKSDIRKHGRLIHFDQTRCHPCGISSFESYVHYKRHKQSKNHVNNCRILGRMWGYGKCREKFSNAEDLAAHKNERKHHDNLPKGS